MRPNCMSTVTSLQLNSGLASPEQLTTHHLNSDPTACQQWTGITSTVSDCSVAVEALILSTVLLAGTFSAFDFAASTYSAAQQLVASLSRRALAFAPVVKEKDKTSRSVEA
jgi:hypothetical protein